MDPILQVLNQPWMVVLIGIAVFVGRVVYLAKRLKSSARNPTFADMRALDEAKKSLDAHKESLEAAKKTLAGNLGGARDTLRTYKKPLTTTIEGRKKEIEETMKSLEATRNKEFEKVRNQTAFSDAKKLYKTALPRKTHRESTKEM